MAGWELIKGRAAKALRALRGDYDHRGELAAWAAGEQLDQSQAAPWGASQWERSFESWSLGRSPDMPQGEHEASYRTGVGLLDALARMDPLDKQSLLRSQERRLHGFGPQRLEAARASCERPRREWASQEARLHSLWCLSSGERVPPKALEEAAMSASRSAWWEVASIWSAELSDISRSRIGSGAMRPYDDMECFGLCESASMIGARALLSAVSRSGSFDERSLAAWSSCCDWPWPERPIGHEVLEWTRRKWRESYFGIDPERFAQACQEIGSESTWADLAQAKLSCGYEVASLPDHEGSLSRLRQMLKARVERESLLQGLDPARGRSGSGRL